MSLPDDLQIGHLLEDADRPGCPISFQWDKEDGIDWIIFKDATQQEIMRIRKNLWDGSAGAGFTPEIRDAILQKTRSLYG